MLLERAHQEAYGNKDGREHDVIATAPQDWGTYNDINVKCEILAYENEIPAKNHLFWPKFWGWRAKIYASHYQDVSFPLHHYVNYLQAE